MSRVRLILGPILGGVLGAVTWHITHHTLVTWIIAVTVTLLIWFGAPIFKTAADIADDIID